MCACMYPCVFSIVSWRAVRVSIGIRHQIVNLSPRPKPIRPTRHEGTPFGAWGCALYGARVSPRMRARPSTCRVLPIDWQGLDKYVVCAAVFGTQVVYASVRVWSLPGELLPSPHRRRSTVFRGLFQQTNKQRQMSHAGALSTLLVVRPVLWYACCA